MTALTETQTKGQDADTAPAKRAIGRKKPDYPTIDRAYVFVLDPTEEQAQQFESHCGGARFAYNYMLAKVKANLDQRAAEKSYGIADADLTPSMSWSAINLNNEFNAAKDVDAPWHTENSSRIYIYATRDLAAALKAFSDSRKGTRKGKPVAFPKFHGKRTRKSFTVSNDSVCVMDTRHHIKLPTIGIVHTMRSTADLYALIEQGRARILRATVSQHRGRWQVSIMAEVASGDIALPPRPTVVGVDVGVKDWLVAGTADGTEVLRVPVPTELHRLDERKRQLQRRNRNRQAPRKGVAPSNRWREAQERINKLDYRMAAIREDTLHKVTSELSERFDVVVVEDLNVAGMMTRGGAYKKGLNRAIARAGMSMSRTMLGYKASELILADRWFPSSKMCSACGAVKSRLGLDERTYVCNHAACGHTMDRDLNAAVNLAKYGELMLDNAGSSPVSGRGAERKPTKPSGAVAAGCEASSPNTGGIARTTVDVAGNGGKPTTHTKAA